MTFKSLVYLTVNSNLKCQLTKNGYKDLLYYHQHYYYYNSLIFIVVINYYYMIFI